MVGSVQKSNNMLYVVTTYSDENGKTKRKWIPTHLEDTAVNKKKALKMVNQLVRDFEEEQAKKRSGYSTNLLFTDYMWQWLENHKAYISESTYEGYTFNVKTICDYFEKQKILLSDLTEIDIMKLYDDKVKSVSANTVRHFHSVISKAINDAYKTKKISKNPMDFVIRPKAVEYVHQYFSVAEVIRLLEVAKGDHIETVINIAVCYGLRRSECLGLKWDAVDFEKKLVHICHTVTQSSMKGKSGLNKSDKLKSKNSRRTLPLIPCIEKILVAEREKQERYRFLFKSAYNNSGEGYICRMPTGELITPNYVTQHFEIVLRNNSLPHIRFHDLRHTFASIAANDGIEMKKLQQWLGHSNYSVTADLYSHLYSNYSSELVNCMENAFGGKNNVI